MSACFSYQSFLFSFILFCSSCDDGVRGRREEASALVGGREGEEEEEGMEGGVENMSFTSSVKSFWPIRAEQEKDSAHKLLSEILSL